jgi:hypothetical protein
LNLEQVNSMLRKMEQCSTFAHPNARVILTLKDFHERYDGQKPGVKPEAKQHRRVKAWNAHT